MSLILAPDLDCMTIVVARDLHEGDEIVNVGTVASVGTFGVWMVARVKTYAPDLTTGRVEIEHRNIFFHSEDTLVLVDKS